MSFCLNIEVNYRAIYVFIDASNIWEAQKAKGKLLDYEKVLEYLRSEFNANVVKVFYYTSYPGNQTRDYSMDGKHKFFTFLKKGLGFNVIKKELKQITIFGKNGRSIVEKGNMDVEIVIDAVRHVRDYDAAILFSGDSDFLALVNFIKDNNKSIFIFSSRNNISHELKIAGDGYYDLLKIRRDVWGKELGSWKGKT